MMARHYRSCGIASRISFLISPSTGTPKPYRWETPEGMPRRELYKRLCSLGQKSMGQECPGCESQCAFGRAFIAMPDTGDIPIKQPAGVTSVIQSITRDGFLAGVYTSLSKAKEALGLKDESGISKGLREGSCRHGYYWRRVPIGHIEATKGIGEKVGPLDVPGQIPA